MLGSSFSRCNIAAKSMVLSSLSLWSRLQEVSKNLPLPICSQHCELIAASKTLSRINYLMRSKVPALPTLLWVPVRGGVRRAGIPDLRACSCLHDKQGAANTRPAGSACAVPADSRTLLASPGWSHCSCVKETSGALRCWKQHRLKNIKKVFCEMFQTCFCFVWCRRGEPADTRKKITAVAFVSLSFYSH